jgi:hypothetical protein
MQDNKYAYVNYECALSSIPSIAWQDAKSGSQNLDGASMDGSNDPERSQRHKSSGLDDFILAPVLCLFLHDRSTSH